MLRILLAACCLLQPFMFAEEGKDAPRAEKKAEEKIEKYTMSSGGLDPTSRHQLTQILAYHSRLAP